MSLNLTLHEKLLCSFYKKLYLSVICNFGSLFAFPDMRSSSYEAWHKIVVNRNLRV
ncbi:hypothetical protein ALT721_2320075 [Alteromonas alvinellae]